MWLGLLLRSLKYDERRRHQINYWGDVIVNSFGKLQKFYINLVSYCWAATTAQMPQTVDRQAYNHTIRIAHKCKVPRPSHGDR